MNKLFLWLTIFVSFAIVVSAKADITSKGHVHDKQENVQNFYNTDCADSDTCTLKRFSLFTRDYEVWFADDPNPSYGTGMLTEYETASLADIEKYAVVQFIRGCVFDNTKNASGEIKEAGGIDIMHFGEWKKFCFRSWMPDSFDKDPVYNSTPDDGRFYFLRWNSVKGLHKFDTENYYGFKRPKYPVVYLSDTPAAAFRATNSARNVSLEFKTCVYRAKDVPNEVEADNINFAEPIKCFNWKSSHIYNWDTENYEPKDELVFP